MTDPQPDVECLGCQREWTDAEAFIAYLEAEVQDLPDRVAGNPEVRWWLSRARRNAKREQATDAEDWTMMTLCVSCVVDELESQGIVDREAG